MKHSVLLFLFYLIRYIIIYNSFRYFGLSSTGITYKSGAPSFGTGSFQSGERYGGFGSTRDGDRFRDSYKGYDSYGGRKTDEDTFGKSRKGDLNDNQENKGKGSSTYGRFSFCCFFMIARIVGYNFCLLLSSFYALLFLCQSLRRRLGH